jgi:hypothetical protein
LYKSQVQVMCGARIKNCPRALRGLIRGFGLELPDHNIQFGVAGDKWLNTRVGAQAPVQLKRGGTALGKAAGKLPRGRKRQKLLGSPQGHGGCTRARALQADFAEMHGAPGERFRLVGVGGQLF